MADVVRELIVRLKAEGVGTYKAAMAEAGGATSSMGAKTQAGAGVASKAIKGVALVAGAAIVAGAKMAATYDQTFTQIGALAGKVGMPLDQAKAKVLDLAKATGQDPEGLAQALYFAASAGLKASQVFPVLRASAQAAAMGMGDAQTVAQTLTSVLNAYKGTGLDTAGVMNIMTAAVRDGKAEMSDFATGLGPIISVAAAAGVSFNDMAAALAEATNQGVPFARAVTGLRFLISGLESPTDKAAKALDSIGLSGEDVASMIKKPGGLESTLQLIHDRTSKMGEDGRKAWSAITGGARGAIVAVDLVGKHTADTSRIVTDLGRSARKGASDFSDAWGKVSKSDAVKLQQAIADVKVALIKLGEKVLPELTPLVSKLGDVLGAVVPLAPAILAVWAAFKGAQFVSALASLGPLQAGLILVTAAVVGFETEIGVLSNDLQKQLHAAIAAGLTDLEALQSKLHDAQQHLETFNWGHILDVLVPGFHQIRDTVDDTTKATDRAVRAWHRHEDELATNARAAQEVTRSLDLLVGRAVPAAAAAASLAGGARRAASELAVAHGVLGKFPDTIDGASKAWGKWRQATAQAINPMDSLLQGLEGRTKLTATGIANAMDRSIASMKRFGDNIAKITSDGSAKSKAFAAYLISLGPAAYGMAAKVAGASKSVRDHIVNDFSKAQSTSQQVAGGIEKSLTGGFNRIAAAILIATGQAHSFADALAQLHDKTITITTHYVQIGSPPAGTPAGAHSTQIPAAAGFHGWVDRPTTLLVGEGGRPERVDVTPRGQMARSSAAAAATSEVVNNVAINFQGPVFGDKRQFERAVFSAWERASRLANLQRGH